MLDKFNTIIDLIKLKIRNFFLNINNQEISSKILIMKIKNEIKKANLPSYILDGYKVYSQNDEDGIINSILNDVGIGNKIFIEIGIGNGVENNTHNLLLQDWHGVWIDSNTNNISKIKKFIEKNNKLAIFNKKITIENINEVIETGLSNISNYRNDKDVDFFSIDIDSIDIFCLDKLEVIKPKIICIEYNSLFPPPMEITINSNHKDGWSHDDYHGASLSYICNVLAKKGYKLVSCNITGLNAFFVNIEFHEKCKTKDLSPHQLYMPPNYNLFSNYQTHKPTLKFLKDKLDSRN